MIKPIISNCCMQRVQIDLMDFRADADGQYKWILQIKDHFSRYIWLFALREKDSKEVAHCLEWWISAFGEPRIIQSDNGSEFKRYIYRLLEKHRIHLINSSPYHPISQGSVEKANGSFKRRLRALRLSSGETGWYYLLPEIARITNTTAHSALPSQVTPYEVFFGRPPRFETQRADLKEVWVDWLVDSKEQEGVIRVSFGSYSNWLKSLA
jgi:transposase InsO family protein